MGVCACMCVCCVRVRERLRDGGKSNWPAALSFARWERREPIHGGNFFTLPSPPPIYISTSILALHTQTHTFTHTLTSPFAPFPSLAIPIFVPDYVRPFLSNSISRVFHAVSHRVLYFSPTLFLSQFWALSSNLCPQIATQV